MYATFLSIEGVTQEGVAEAEKRRFKSMDDLRANVQEVQVLQPCEDTLFNP